jgi:hypothetical protein
MEQFHLFCKFIYVKLFVKSPIVKKPHYPSHMLKLSRFVFKVGNFAYYRVEITGYTGLIVHRADL